MADSTPLEPDQMAAYLALMEVGSLLQHAVDQQLRESGGLTYTQLQILAALENSPQGALRMTDLADSIVYSRSGLTYQVTRMTAAGLVTRATADDDERSIVVTPTASGREALGLALPGHVAVVRDLLTDQLTGPETAALARALGRVRDRMRTRPPRSTAGQTRVKSPSFHDRPK
ncbi:MAG TPA: MarR family transcriptional regulator [Nocardioides sp.]|nr:MarR family transcriptional regulator [Nocardioides sp.]